MKDKKLYTVTELAPIIGLSKNRIHIKVLQGEIPALRFGRTIRFDLDEVIREGKRRRR